MRPDFTQLMCTRWLLNCQHHTYWENFCLKKGNHPFLCQDLYLSGFLVSVIAVSSLGLITAIAFFFIKNFSSKFFFYRVFRQVWESILIFLCVIFKVTLCDLCLGQKFSWSLLVDIFPFCFVNFQIKKNFLLFLDLVK